MRSDQEISDDIYKICDLCSVENSDEFVYQNRFHRVCILEDGEIRFFTGGGSWDRCEVDGCEYIFEIEILVSEYDKG